MNRDPNYLPDNEEDDILPDYDFTGKVGVRGKNYKKYRAGHTVRIYNEDGTYTEQRFAPIEGSVVLDPDVRAYFPDEESVNNALRTLIALVHPKSA